MTSAEDAGGELLAGLSPEEWRELDDAALLEAPPRGGALTLAVDVRLVHTRRLVTAEACDAFLRRGAHVVLETERGLSLGLVVREAHRLRVEAPLMRVVRAATAEDLRQAERNERREAQALQFCWERVRARELPMKLVKVEFLHGGNKAVFYFAADGRIDFRELVKDLAYRLQIRVEMRQIGVRDVSKVVGGVGPCGRELCCSSWLQRFEPVSIRMAKTQNLSLNPQKVSGVCGRLMCCLAYEQESYQSLRKRLPRLGKPVTTPRGAGRVTELDILRQRVRVTFADASVVEFEAGQVQGERGGPADERDDDVPEELRQLDEENGTESRPRLPAAGREVVSAPRAGRRKPWQDGRGRRPPDGGSSGGPERS